MRLRESAVVEGASGATLATSAAGFEAVTELDGFVACFDFGEAFVPAVLFLMVEPWPSPALG
jgi:hypothetical protein